MVNDILKYNLLVRIINQEDTVTPEHILVAFATEGIPKGICDKFRYSLMDKLRFVGKHILRQDNLSEGIVSNHSFTKETQQAIIGELLFLEYPELITGGN